MSYFGCFAVGTGSRPERSRICFDVSSGLFKLSQQCRVELRNTLIQNEFSGYFPGERENGRSGWV